MYSFRLLTGRVFKHIICIVILSSGENGPKTKTNNRQGPRFPPGKTLEMRRKGHSLQRGIRGGMCSNQSTHGITTHGQGARGLEQLRRSRGPGVRLRVLVLTNDFAYGRGQVQLSRIQFSLPYISLTLSPSFHHGGADFIGIHGEALPPPLLSPY